MFVWAELISAHILTGYGENRLTFRQKEGMIYTNGGMNMELLCPICAEVLRQTDRTFRCDSGHSFDMARQG